MDSPGTDRGQALQVGAILLFGILILFLTIYQATAVPAQNKRVEFDSYLEASSDMENVRNDVRYVASRDAVAGTTVKTGAEYPARVVFVNPGPPANRLRTVDSGSFTVSNASAVGSEAAGTRAFWDGSSRSYETKGLRLDTDYNELQVPPVVHEPGVIYRPANDSVEPPYGPDEVILLSGQSVVEGDRLTLVSMAGRIDAGGRRTLVTTEPKSAHTRTVVVENDTGNVTVTVPSSLSAETWDRSLLADQQDPGDAVVAVRNNTSTPDYSAVDVVLRPGSYQLRLAKVEVRREADSSSVADPKPAYVVGTAGDEASVSRDQRVRLTAEVRDRFNNQISGEEILFRTSDGTFATGGSSANISAGGEGQASALFEPDQAGTLTVRAGLDSDGDTALSDEDPLNVTTFTVYVSESTSPQYSLQWDTTAIESNNPNGIDGCSDGVCTYDLADSNDQLSLTANTTPETAFAGVDFATNDTTIVSNFNPTDNTTDSAGEASTTATLGATGTASVYASSTESSDELTVEVIDSSTGGGGGSGVAQNVELSFKQINNGDIRVTIRNDNAQGVDLNQMELDSYTDANVQGNQPIDRVVYQFDGTELLESDGFRPVSGPSLSNSESQDLTFTPQRPGSGQGQGQGSGPKDTDAGSGDSMQITIEFGDGSTRTYIVNVP
jgi:hypothetical protein